MRVDPPTITTSSICSTADASVLDAIAARAERAIDDRRDQLVEQLAIDLALVFLAVVFELDGRCRNERQPLLGLDHGAAQPLHAFAVLGQILAPLARDVFERDAQQQVVDVVAAQVRVAVGGQHFEDSVVQLQDRDVERAAAQIVHRDDAVLALVESVGERGGRRFVDQAQNFEAGDAAGVLGGLPLGVVEIGRHRDDGLVDRHAEIRLRHSASTGAERCAEISGGVNVRSPSWS